MDFFLFFGVRVWELSYWGGMGVGWGEFVGISDRYQGREGGRKREIVVGFFGGAWDGMGVFFSLDFWGFGEVGEGEGFFFLFRFVKSRRYLFIQHLSIYLSI